MYRFELLQSYVWSFGVIKHVPRMPLSALLGLIMARDGFRPLLEEEIEVMRRRLGWDICRAWPQGVPDVSPCGDHHVLGVTIKSCCEIVVAPLKYVDTEMSSRQKPYHMFAWIVDQHLGEPYKPYIWCSMLILLTCQILSGEQMSVMSIWMSVHLSASLSIRFNKHFSIWMSVFNIFCYNHTI